MLKKTESGPRPQVKGQKAYPGAEALMENVGAPLSDPATIAEVLQSKGSLYDQQEGTR
jgi:hypothetical protein